MSVKIRTPFQRKWHTTKHEPGGGEDLTVPDQAMSIRELLLRNSRGLPLGGQERVVFYNGEDDDLPDIKKLDLSEIHDLKEQSQKTIKKALDEQEQREREKADKALEKHYREKFRKEKSDVAKASDTPAIKGNESSVEKPSS